MSRPIAFTSWGAFGPGWLWIQHAAVSGEIVIGQAAERETANPVIPVIGRMVAFDQTTESEAANPIIPLMRREVSIGRAHETELARFITPGMPIVIPVQTAVERELARIINPQLGQPFRPTLTCVISSLDVTCDVYWPGKQ